METLDRVLRRRDDIVARHVAGEQLLIPVRGRLADMQRIFALDPVAEHIWSRLDGATPLAAILGSVVDTFEVDEAQARRDVLEFVTELEAAGLVEPAPS